MSRSRIDVEALIQWTYGSQKAHLSSGLDRDFMWLAGSSNSAAIEALAGLGCRVQTPSAAIAGKPFKVHHDAEIVNDIVSQKCGAAQEFIIRFGVNGLRPDWKPGACFRAIRETKRNGEPIVETTKLYDGNRHVVGESEAWPVRWIDWPDQVIAARTIYRGWHAGMALVYEIASRLIFGSWEVDSFKAAAHPWPVEEDRIWLDLQAAVAKARKEAQDFDRWQPDLTIYA